MSNTDDVLVLRQATFDTDPINLRKQGANIQLPVIEGDREIRTVQSTGESSDVLKHNTDERHEIVLKINEKNRTRVIDTKADIQTGVKAISQKAKAHHKEQRNKVYDDKTKNDNNETENQKEGNKTNKINERKDTTVVNVKPVSEKTKTHKKEQKHLDGSENLASGSSVSGQLNLTVNKNNDADLSNRKREPLAVGLKAINEKAKSLQGKQQEKLVTSKKLAKVNEEENSSESKLQISEKNDSININVKAIQENSKAKQEELPDSVSVKKKTNDIKSAPVHKVDESSKTKKSNSKEETNKKEHAKVITLAQVTSQKGVNTSVKTIKSTKHSSHAAKETVKTVAHPLKDAVKTVSDNQNKTSSQENNSSHKTDQTKGINNKKIFDNSTVKAGISVNKDAHSASGIVVANGASPKVSADTTRTNAPVSKLTVGSAPRITTLGGAQQNKDQTETSNAVSTKSKQQLVNQITTVNVSELEIETVKQLSDRTGSVSKEKLDLNAVKIAQEPTISNESAKMANTGSVRSDIRRGESYDAIYAERNTLLKAEMAYKRRIKQLEDEANSFLKTIEELTAENNRMQSRLEILESELKNSRDDNMDERSLSLQQENEVLKKQVKELENASKVVSNTKESNDGSANQMTELKAQVVKLQTENQNVNEELIKVKAELLSESRKLHAMEKEKKSLANSVTAVESEKLDKIQDLQKDHSKMKKENQAQKDKIDELEKKLNVLEFENKTLSESLTQKKSELEELLGVMKDENKFDNEIKDLKNLVIKLEKDKKEMELKNNVERRKLQEELDETTSKYEKSKSEADELQIKNDDIVSKNKKFVTENKSLTSTRESQKKEIDELKKEIERLKKELVEIQKELDGLKHETENAATNLKDANTKLEDTNKELQSVVSDKEGQISKLIAQIDNLRTEKDAEKQEFGHEKETLTSEIDRLKIFERHINTMERELKHFVEKLEQSENRKEQLLNELEDKDDKISALEKQIFELNMKIDSLTKRISQLDRDKREVENDKREWEVKRDKINDIEASNKRLMEENRRLRGSLEDKHLVNSNNAPTVEKPLKGREAWVDDTDQTVSLQKAVFVENKNGKKRVQIAPQPMIQKRRVPFTKSGPVKLSKPPSKKKELRTALSPSRSLEDLRKSPPSPADSSPSLPELQKDGRLTYGFSYHQGYSQIHRNRIRAAQKRVY